MTNFDLKMSQQLFDYLPGPLDKYRKKASFDWKKLKIFLETEEIVQFQAQFYSEIKKNMLLHPSPGEKSVPYYDQIELAQKRMTAFRQLPSFTDLFTNHNRGYICLKLMSLVDPSACGKLLIQYTTVTVALNSLGTERHQRYLDEIFQHRIFACYCLTEIGHGTNAKAIGTTATYDIITKEFILNTPNFQATKSFGFLGKYCTHAVIYAQLILPDGNEYGPHPFFVKVRDPKTLKMYPGVTEFEMGERMGINGMDNRCIIFNQYRISKEDLLNKYSDVTEDGQFTTNLKDITKYHASSLAPVSTGRIIITGIAQMCFSRSLTTAIRYAAVRKQFGPGNGEELSILEYQNHQYRLLPYLSAAYILQIFEKILLEHFWKFLYREGGDETERVILSSEIHAIISACKPVMTWMARDAQQECREACGGHGYLKAAGIGEFKNNTDGNATYEGDNHVIIQQTSNWLLKFWPLILKEKSIHSPLKSIDFLTNGLKILNAKFSVKTIEDAENPENLIIAYQWLICHFLKETYNKSEDYKRNGLSSFWIKSESQVYFRKNLAVTYINHLFLQQMLIKIKECHEKDLQNVLTKLFLLFGWWSLEKYMASFYQGGFMTGSQPLSVVQNTILKLCNDLKDDAVALVDVIAAPDFLLNSILGHSDGLVYEHIKETLTCGDTSSLPTWWKNSDIKSKL